jgi:uncharacterized protein
LIISKHEQHVLHEFALGGEIHYQRGENGKATEITYVSRDGHALTNCTIPVFHSQKKHLARSQMSRPYRISRLGVTPMRAQMNQR